MGVGSSDMESYRSQRPTHHIQLDIPKLLVGRERLTEKLETLFVKASRGPGKIILVPGQSGIGKTSLVEWLKKPVLDQNGVFIQAKFDQYQQNTPYYALSTALSLLWQHIQTERNEDLEVLKISLHKTVGDLGSLLVELVPELEDVFSDQPGLEEIAISEARHRFTRAIRGFLEVVSQPDHPVVIFLDDWQWADQASLNLLRALKPDSTLSSFLLIVSFRDDEIDTTHPLQPVLSAMQSQNRPPEVLEVKSLTEDDVETLVSGIFQYPVENLNELTRLVRQYTGGNPFYIISLLEYLCENRQLFFDSHEKKWRWQVGTKDLPDNIVELFIRRLKFFSGHVRELLAFAACLGNIFDIESLSLISSLSTEQCITKLTPLQERGFLLFAEEDGGSVQKRGGKVRFRFMHDRVQQAAYHFIDSSNIQNLQLKIGRQLMASLNERERNDRLFEILEHLNAGASLIVDPAERVEMIDLNMQAARKAKTATAYRAMLTFNREAYSFAMEEENGAESFWKNHYDTALQLSRDLAESEFVEGDRERAERIVEHSMEHTRTAVERAETMNIQIVHYTLLARYEEAISLGRTALQELGISLPEKEYERYRDREIAKCRTTLDTINVSSLIDAPLMSNSEVQTAIRLLITIGPPCYRTHQRLWSVIVSKVVNLTLEHGLIPQIGYSHTAFGGLLGWVDHDYRTARQFGEVAERIMLKRFASPSDQSVFYLMMGSSIRHWFKHLRHATTDYLSAYDIGLRSGNLQYAAYAFGHNMYCSFYQAVPLPELIRNTEQSLVFSQSRLNQWAVDLLEGGLRIFGMLSSESEKQLYEFQDDASYLRQVDSHKNIQVCCIYKIFQTFTYLLLGQYHKAHDIAKEADALIYTVGTQGLLPWPEHRFVRFLVISALFQDADAEKQAVWRKELGQSIEQFRVWKEYCPENQHHKFLFASGELLRIDGSYSQALVSYDKAIEMARHNGFTQWEGIASERASLLCRQMHNDNLAQVYWQQAYNCFRRFGATSKVRRMEMEYSDDIQSWLMNLHATQPPTPTRDISSDFVEEFQKRHLHRVRSIANDVLKTRQSRDVAIEAGKQAKATERLRTEIARRKREEKERVRLEEEIRHRHKMEAIGTLAGGIAHEFNNMLTIIIGNLELVADEERDNEELMSCITDIQAASLRARNVVERLQRFARKSAIVKKPVQIRTVVKDALKLLSKTLPATVEIQSRLLCATESILADPTEIHQVLINLCNNAVQAMSGTKGVLGVTLESLYLADGLRVRDMELGPGAYIQLIVNDSGSGISDEIKDRIYDPYFTTKDVDEGLGMGLAVVLGIVKNHDGAISVESQLGRGTRFKVLLPVIETVEEPATTPTESATTTSRQKHILFVDDEEAITRMNQQIFERLGYQITTYNSPQHALEAFRDAPDTFDLVISDLTMPEMTGTEFALKLKSIRSSIPVIISTGHADVVNEMSAAKWGVEAFITKPFTKREIEGVVRDIFDNTGQ